MNATRARRVVFVLVGLCLLASLALLLVVASGFWSSDEPTYEGKSVSVWFKEYAYASNAPAAPLRNLGARRMPDGRMVLMQIDPAGRLVTLQAPTNPAAQIVWLQQQMSPLPARDPAWEALQALGSNAVPCLVRHFRSSVIDRTFERAFTNLPSAIQMQLPDPSQKQWLRIRAIDTLARLKLGESGHAATPYLLELLKQRDSSQRRAIGNALRSLHVDRRTITRVLLKLGSQRKYADVVEIAWQMGWEGDDMARLLAEILQSPDPALRREAMALLERSGTAAAPVLDAIVRALRDSDKEVRYLAARSVEAIGTNSPQVVAALRSVLEDEQVTVRTVARRALTNIAPDAIPPLSAGEAGRN
jgi:hypothetical protein